MNRADIYAKLEEKMLEHTDYSSVPLRPIPENLVPIPKTGRIVGRQIGEDMRPYAGDAVLVRWSVLQKLRQAAKLLGDQSTNARLEVVHGYRAPTIQMRMFEEHMRRLKSSVGSDELIVATHRAIAVPEVAGHSTGGAVDIRIINGDNPIDMGTSIWQFVPDSFTFSPFISRDAWSNRQLLRRVMTTAGFAPFDGEWWHFSYGDKRWARYFGEQAAIYGQVELDVRVDEATP